MTLEVLDNSCACSICVGYCKRPGWFSPEEAKVAIEAGYGSRLMLDFWERDEEEGGDIFILAPANPNYEGKEAFRGDILFNLFAVFFRDGYGDLESGCTFLTKESKCSIHSIKPLECKLARHDTDSSTAHRDIAFMWDNEEAQQLVESWTKEYFTE